MGHVFGPVPSRRLGNSLGVDPVPFKTCNSNCVYCQLGRTSPVTTERRDYFPPGGIVGEVKLALDFHDPGDIDWVTFVASGETCLHAHLGLMIRQVKDLTDLPVAVITNGSLLYLPEVREALMPADAVLPSLDAGSEELYRSINRPHPSCTFSRLTGGLAEFGQTYRGQMWVEVMLLKNKNDSKEALTEIAETVARIGPDAVHISTPVRPPAEAWVEPPDEEGVARARAILGERSWVVSRADEVSTSQSWRELADAIMEVILRHPMAEDELVRTLGRWTAGEVHAALANLAASGRAQVVERYGARFWSSRQGSYGQSLS